MTIWMEDAKCRENEMPLVYFFEDYLRSREIYDLVNSTCRACPVRTICLNYGKNMKSTGVWGGRWLQNGVIVKTITKTVVEENIL